MDDADPLEDALADLRIAGTVVLHEAYAAPWAIEVPDQATLGAMLARPRERIIPFHLVLRGGFCLTYPGTATVDIGPHEMAICTGGAVHQMRKGASGAPISICDILAGSRSPPSGSGATDADELICGVFVLSASPLNPLLGSLPPVMTIATQGIASDPILADAAAMLAKAVQRPRGFRDYTSARIVELLCAESIRAFARRAQIGDGWAAGLNDHKIRKALSRIHGAPGSPWQVASLAAHVALSPSRFAARFRAVVGESVLSYLTRWRMTLACRLLQEADRPISDVALAVGYDSVPAFARAFRARIGQPPGQWRRSFS